MEKTFDQIKQEALKEVRNKWKDTKNPYDRYTGEDSYWNCQDALFFLESATTETEMSRAKRLFDRNHYKIAIHS